jgi:hypothetical protein
LRVAFSQPQDLRLRHDARRIIGSKVASKTIANFHADNEPAISKVCAQFVVLCR